MEKLIFLVICFISCANGWWIFSSERDQEVDASREIDEACIAKAEAGDCRFYICFDQRHMCDHHNYALSYGWRYCDLMDKNMDKFTPEAQEWVRNTRRCSMAKMLEHYRAPSMNCYDVENNMQNSHAECEADNGVCDPDLLANNKDVLMDIYKVNRKAMVRFFNMIKECGSDVAMDIFEWMKEQSKSIVDVFSSLKARFEDLEDDLADDLADLRESLSEISELPEVPDIN